MKIFNEAMPVDAGLMAIVSAEVLKKYGKREDRDPDFPWRFIRLKKAGAVELSINAGDHEEKTKKLKAGRYYVGDPCYVIKDWDRFLKDTDYCNSDLDNCIFLGNFGGDGLHEVEVNIL